MNDIEKAIFARSHPDRNALLAYGFQPEGTALVFSGAIADGEFTVRMEVSGSGDVSSAVLDTANGEEYLPIFAEAHTGAFVGHVREEYAAFLSRIKEACFISTPFQSEQANRIAGEIADKYGEREDRPFAKNPEHSVFRAGRTKKWYALIMHIKKSLLSSVPEDDFEVDVMNLKIDPAEADSLLRQPGIFPAYHMNHASWISVILDGTVEDDEILRLIGVSRSYADPLAASGRTSYLIPSNPRLYDVDAEFERKGQIMWHEPRGVRVGDTVYIYYGSPVSAVRYRCEVTAVDLVADYDDDRPQMLLHPTMRYDDSFCTFARLNELGIRAVRGTRRVGPEFTDYMDGYKSAKE